MNALTLYLTYTTRTLKKENERNCRGEQTGIATYVLHDDQTLPVEMNQFWSMSQNLFSFYQFFIKWLLTKDTSGKTISLGECYKYDQNTCILVSITKTKRPLRWCHEDTDDRIMYHLSHAVRIQKYDNLISWYGPIYWWNL